MDKKYILSKTDHTLLAQGADFEQIKALCDDAIKYGTASVCIAPSFVKAAKKYVGNKMQICTVIGFPNGYNTTSVKCFETRDAVANGADEIDMVINIGMLKEKRYDDILSEINAIKDACDGRILKVIIETCLLTDDEKIKMCEIVSNSNADYIKTSTGFSTGGATFDDIKKVEVSLKVVKPEVAENKEAGIKILIPNGEFYASKVCDTFEEAIDLDVEALGKQLVKYKEKQRSK